MLEKTQAQPSAFVGTFDDARDICYNEGSMPRERHHPEVGLQSGKGIVRDFRSCRGDDGQERAFPRVGLSHQADVGYELEHQLDLAIFSLFSRLPLTGGLM